MSRRGYRKRKNRNRKRSRPRARRLLAEHLRDAHAVHDGVHGAPGYRTRTELEAVHASFACDWKVDDVDLADRLPTGGRPGPRSESTAKQRARARNRRRAANKKAELSLVDEAGALSVEEHADG